MERTDRRSRVSALSSRRTIKAVRALRGRFHRLERPLVLALAVRALGYAAGLQPFLDQVAGSAIGTLLGERLAPRHEVALRITVAAVERFAALGTPLHHLTFRTV